MNTNEVITKIKQQKRFNINPHTLQLLEKRNVKSFELIEIPVGKIRRHLDGKVMSLYKTDPYKFLSDDSDTAKENYEKYVNRPLNREDNPDRSVECFNTLINSFSGELYDIKKGIIIVNQFYQVMDGQHRSCILLKKYGEDLKIPVLKIKFGDYKIIGKIRINNFLYNIKKLFGKEV